MPGDYGVLAPIYDRIGMGKFAETVTPRLVNYAQRNGWMGRRIIDLGCGTGAAALWFTQHGYFVTGIDNSPEMMMAAKVNVEDTGIAAQWLEQDIRELVFSRQVDMVIALNVLNELESLRDLEATFKGVHSALVSERMFIFDMFTVEGLTHRNGETNIMVYEGDDLTIMGHNHYDYDRQVHTRRYTIFQREEEGELWQRAVSKRVLRAYPVQAVATLLKRCGFEVKAAMGLDLKRFEPGGENAARAIFMAQKQES